jgi:hypothetical protein
MIKLSWENTSWPAGFSNVAILTIIYWKHNDGMQGPNFDVFHGDSSPKL